VLVRSNSRFGWVVEKFAALAIAASLALQILSTGRSLVELVLGVQKRALFFPLALTAKSAEANSCRGLLFLLIDTSRVRKRTRIAALAMRAKLAYPRRLGNKALSESS